jgi:hypothetical protein
VVPSVLHTMTREICCALLVLKRVFALQLEFFKNVEDSDDDDDDDVDGRAAE